MTRSKRGRRFILQDGVDRGGWKVWLKILNSTLDNSNQPGDTRNIANPAHERSPDMKPNKIKSELSNCNNEVTHLEAEIAAAQNRIKLAKEQIAFLKEKQKLYAKKGSFNPKQGAKLPPEGQQVGGKV